jgi:tetratricopeptide (TPR) repeat protein
MRSMGMKALVGVMALGVILPWALAWIAPPLGLSALGTLLLLGGAGLVGAGLGIAVRVLALEAPRLARAEALWATRAPAGEVLAMVGSASVARGEIGYRLALLRGRARWALGQRDAAWLDYLDAQLRRLPAWKRPFLAAYFQRVPEHPSAAHIRKGERLVRWAPGMGRLRHLLGILELRRGDAEASRRAWLRFSEALPLSVDDPLVVEDLMLAALAQDMPELAERALRMLADHHGDPRLAWDRATAAFHFLRTGRPAQVIALLEPLPEEARSLPMHWLGLSAAYRMLGDREAAHRAVEAGLHRHPGTFRLWMERYLVCLERREEEEAFASLEKAQPLIPADPSGEAHRQEWSLRRAEFAFWNDGDPEEAWKHLATLPEDAQGDHHPPLRLQIQVALGQYEPAYAEVRRLLEHHPGDPPLLLLQADCMAGLEAWEPLLEYLDGLGEGCREAPAFWHLRGLAHAHLKDPLKARVDLERAARMDPGRLRFLLDAGHACAELGEWDRAEMHWRQTLTVDPQSEEALIHLAEARTELADPEGARRYLRECLLHHPESTEAQDRLAELEAN